MFEQQDFEEISARMLSNVDDKFDKREGSVIYDAVAPTASELAVFYANLDMVLDEVFADTASYYYLVKRAAERGLLPKEETNAILKMVVSPADTAITAGDRFHLGELNYTVVKPDGEEPGAYQVECETAGATGNQQLGLLLPLETAGPLNELETAELTEVLIPGEEEEEVEAFRERYFASFKNEAFGGNKADYIEKVSKIDGIGGCKPVRAWSGGYSPADMIPDATVQTWFAQQSEETLGAEVYAWVKKIYSAAVEKLLTVGGTVKVIIINSDFRKPSSTLVQKVQTELDPSGTAGDGDGIAPMGHVVNVVGVKEIPVNIRLSLEYESGSSYSTLKDTVRNVIDDYLLDLRQSWSSSDSLIIRISQIEAQLLSVSGIADVISVMLNGQEQNIILEGDSIPVRGDIIG